MEEKAVTGEVVRVLADLATLPLSGSRAADLAPQLAVWIELANELSEKMSAADHRTLIPMTVFRSSAGGIQP